MKFLSRMLPCMAVMFGGALHSAEPGFSLDIAAQGLLPGAHVWGEDHGAGPVTLLISIPDQRLYVYRDGLLIGAAAVSTGKAGKATPPGDFAILQKRRWHRSNLYSNAPMPFMQRLTWDGIALHAGDNPGRPSSHGCIRLPDAFARELFALTGLGSPVAVVAYRLNPSLAFRIEGIDWAADAAEPVSWGADAPLVLAYAIEAILAE